MISNIEYEAYKKGYRILLCNSQEKEEKEKEYIEICTSNRVAGIILFSGIVNVDTFVRMDIPVITMERYLGNGTASVECDNQEGGILAAQKLIQNGCRNLMMIGSTASDIRLPADYRAVGFRKVCDEQQISYIEIDPELSSYNNMTYDEMLEEALRKYPQTDGVFASSDVIAAQTLQVCSRMNISVPEQMKIIGFDDVSLAQLTTPKLTTIHQPIKEMAESAIGLLADAAEGRLIAKKTLLPVRLIERGTTV